MTKLTNKSELLNAITDRLKEIYDISQDEIDALSVAIISDFVSKLNVAMTTSDYTDDYGVFHPSAKLYALPELMEK